MPGMGHRTSCTAFPSTRPTMSQNWNLSTNFSLYQTDRQIWRSCVSRLCNSPLGTRQREWQFATGLRRRSHSQLRVLSVIPDHISVLSKSRHGLRFDRWRGGERSVTRSEGSNYLLLLFASPVCRLESAETKCTLTRPGTSMSTTILYCILPFI
jgi:hypothetical protein